MPTQELSAAREGISLHQLKQTPENEAVLRQLVEKSLAHSPRIGAIVATLDTMLPGFRTAYEKRLQDGQP